MRIKIYAFTDTGKKLRDMLVDRLKDRNDPEASDHFAAEDFKSFDALIFIGAAGIAIRLIAPYVKDKLKDPAVIVIDEKANFVIPILSGHVGGANALSGKLAGMLGAVPVITTATDVNGVMAIDELAAKNNLKIVNRDNIKKVSSGLLKGKPVNISFDDHVVITGSESELDEKILGLVYAPLVVGLGMRKNTDAFKLEKFFLTTIEACGYKAEDVSGLASVDLKKDEPALSFLKEKYSLPCYFYSAEELNRITGDFDESDFVRQTVGCGDVSARAAKALGGPGDFILKKRKEDGMTISVFRKYRRITFAY